MLLGKRSRPPMKRTTSMTEFTLDLNGSNHPVQGGAGAGNGLDNRFTAGATPSPRPLRRNSADFVETAHFLKACFLCKRRLIPGRDIYMYRGDSAFCSLECRHQQMTQDERKEKCLFASKKQAPTTATGQEVTATSEKIAAV